MDDIKNIQDDNLGGLKLVRFAPWNFFTTVRSATFKAGYDWITVKCTSESMRFRENRKMDAAGNYIDTIISGSVPKVRPDITDILQKYAELPVVVECEDNNGYLRRAGITGRLMISDQADSGENVTDLNGYQVTFAGKQLKPAVFL